MAQFSDLWLCADTTIFFIFYYLHCLWERIIILLRHFIAKKNKWNSDFIFMWQLLVALKIQVACLSINSDLSSSFF